MWHAASHGNVGSRRSAQVWPGTGRGWCKGCTQNRRSREPLLEPGGTEREKPRALGHETVMTNFEESGQAIRGEHSGEILVQEESCSSTER